MIDHGHALPLVAQAQLGKLIGNMDS